jgi:hypothetical protein
MGATSLHQRLTPTSSRVTPNAKRIEVTLGARETIRWVSVAAAMSCQCKRWRGIAQNHTATLLQAEQEGDPSSLEGAPMDDGQVRLGTGLTVLGEADRCAGKVEDQRFNTEITEKGWRPRRLDRWRFALDQFAAWAALEKRRQSRRTPKVLGGALGAAENKKRAGEGCSPAR